MHTNQTTPVAMVSRSRLRSTTDEEPREEDMPPPNRSDRPPPLPLCSKTSSIMSKLVMISTTENPMITAAPVLPPQAGATAQSLLPYCRCPLFRTSRACLCAANHVLAVPADSREVTRIEAG